jgi:hypothetical protein
MLYYLYKKTHKITGLNYLGKTISKDPYSYTGSGVYWRQHLEEYGYDINTEILRECSTVEELKQWGEYYSKLWNVVESKEWANLIEESGPGGYWSIKSKTKLSNTKKAELAKLTPAQHADRIKNSCSSPESWTTHRCEKISKALTGITRSTETRNKIAAANATRTKIDWLKCGDSNRGKTWKLIDGKRVWVEKETVL